jgi:putative nucleotidyltransferase with HDIG domain
MQESASGSDAAGAGPADLFEPVPACLHLDVVLDGMARVLGSLVEVSGVSLKLVDSASEVVLFKRGADFAREIVYGSRILAGDGFAAKALAAGRTTVVEDLDGGNGSACPSYVAREGFKSLVAVPLVYDGRALGLITVYLRERCEIPSQVVAIASMVAGVTASVVRHADLLERMEKNYFATVEALTAAIEAKDPYTRGHSKRVTQLAMVMAEHFGLSETDARNLKYGATLHDIGKVVIRGQILNKRGRLTREEIDIIKQHPAIGERIIERVDFLQGARPIVRSHHERFDGTGYPDGLRDEEIPFLARIAAIVDLFDALTTERPYRNAYSPQETSLIIKQGIGSEFDPVVAKEFLEIARNLGPGAGGRREVPVAAAPPAEL